MTHGPQQHPQHLSALVADLDARSHTHSFRRSRANHLYQAKMAPAAVCKITGHRSVAQLMEYIDIATDEAAAEAAAITTATFPKGIRLILFEA